MMWIEEEEGDGGEGVEGGVHLSLVLLGPATGQTMRGGGWATLPL